MARAWQIQVRQSIYDKRVRETSYEIPSQARPIRQTSEIACLISSRGACAWTRVSLEIQGILTHKGCRILYRITLSVVVEVSPNTNCATFSDTARPDSQFFCRIIVPVPLAHAVETNVKIIGCLNQLIRKLRTANRAKNGTGFAKSSKDSLIPPAGMAELYDVAPIMIKLEQNGL